MNLHVPNRLKKLLAEGKTAYGTCICTFHPGIVELAVISGFDFCRIDNEHAWRQDESTEHVLRAAHLAGITPLVRIDKGNPYLIRKVLEIGASGVIVPEIRNAAEARAAVRAAKFPPLGDRGYSTLGFSGRYGTAAAADWIKWSNEETLVVIMIEKTEAVTNIDSILAVPGVDIAMFGPADYSVAIGLPGPDKNHRRVQDGLRKTVKAAQRHGKHVIIPLGQPWSEEAAKYSDMGCRLLEIGHDYSMLSWAWKHALGAAQRGIGK